MTPATRDILRDPELLRLRERWMDRLAGLFAGERFETAFVLCGAGGGGRPEDLYGRPEVWIAEALDDLAGKADGLRDTIVFRPVSINPWLYGVHFIDRILGATVYELRGERDNWQAEYLPTPVGALRPPDLAADATWKLARRYALAFLEAEVTLPFFAPPVLSSPLNIALNLYGQRILVAMMEDPEAARRDLRVITDVILALHRWYRERIPETQLQMVEIGGRIQPRGHGQLCGCSTHLLSGDQYAEFIAPLDDEVLSLYPNGGLIHLCGGHTQHLPVWRALRSVRALQVNHRAAEDVPAFFAGLRDDQVLYVNPFEEMPVERIMEITGGHRLVIAGEVKDPLPTE